MMAPEFALGRQLTVDFYRCPASILADTVRLEAIFVQAAHDAGATVLASHFHNFEPQGSSGVVIISESHFAVHAWPEYGYAAVDIFTCSDRVNFEQGIASLQGGLNAHEVVVSRAFSRGRIDGSVPQKDAATDFKVELQSSTPSWATRYRRTHAEAMSLTVDIYDCRTLTAPEGWQPDIYGVDLEMQLRANCDTRTVYADFFSKSFFEPRVLAEEALRVFGGSHYKMQVDLRY